MYSYGQKSILTNSKIKALKASFDEFVKHCCQIPGKLQNFITHFTHNASHK